MHERLKFLY